MLSMSQNRWPRLVVMGLLLATLAAGVSACGKRGDPYRPTEISNSAS